jgi:LysM repeat protein
MRETDLHSFRGPQVLANVSLRKPSLCGFAIVLSSCLFYGATPCRAQEAPSQDVAVAARQERARKESEKKPPHIYTEEDLRRPKILTADDEARLAAARKLPPPSAPAQAADSLDANADPTHLPLGDVARHYRNAKRLAEPAFHLPATQPAFASPVPPSEPHAIPHAPVVFSPALPRIMPVQPMTAMPPASAPVRRDPFSRRLSHIAPQASVAPPRLVAPFAPFAPFAPPAPTAVAPRAPAIRQVAPASNLKSAVPANNATPDLPPAASQIIIVRPGDSLWKISEQHLGRGSKWSELLAANPSIANPDILEVGAPLHVPTEIHRPRVTKVKVSAGDTLTKIAQAQYGRASYWRYIAQANPTVSDPNRIYEGQALVLPPCPDP